jgi:hypothetical protein
MIRPTLWLVAAVLVLTAKAATCTPDLATYTPTPTLKWDQVTVAPGSVLVGYKLFWRFPGGTFQFLVDLPCWTEEDGSRNCPGGALIPDLAVQRFVVGQLETIEFALKAYDTRGGVSVDFSNAVSICMPEIYPGRPAPYR